MRAVVLLCVHEREREREREREYLFPQLIYSVILH